MTTLPPKHIAIIMDGNGRWAETQQLPRHEGHIAGLHTAKKIIQSALDQDISILSLFAFSSENWKRPATEVSGLMQLFIFTLEQELASLDQKQIAVRFIGNPAQLSPLLQKLMVQAEQQTQSNKRLILNLAINYGGKWDILEATKKICHKVLAHELSIDDLDENQFDHYLSTTRLPEPDLFIRTSGEQRISNFFLWQLAYTELYFSPVYWPDFNETHFIEAIQAFQHRKRRFGKASHHES